ncbi:RES domain-containing protein [Nocardioides alpinus]|uniref:RES domain-containing protein n=1 Tax=Nocardioides alpinus TaxID=748909 RepID=A0A1I0VWC7_9ACTN|nr:RES family NAD+ phosphorylase [Nocardioides alpinus]SFA80498.1 RES domain-containing protein [Nocardioides alpinus]
MTTSPRGQSLHPLPPRDASELARFPSRTVDGTWFRAHVDRGGRDRGCWWFASVRVGDDPDACGRFDLPAPQGTCYVASTEEAAARERVGTQLRSVGGRESVLASVLVTPEGPVTVTATEVALARAANLAVKPAQRWVDRSLSVGTGVYSVTQAWAAAFREAELDGIVHPSRFTGGARVRSLAVFGRAGRPRPVPVVRRSRPLRMVLESHDVRVVLPPSSAPSVLTATAAPPPL